MNQQQPQQYQVRPRRAKCSQIGKVTLSYVIISCCCFVACSIAGLCIGDYYLPFDYMALNSASIFTQGYAWRLFSSYITPSSIWNCLLINLWLCLMLYRLEAWIGSKKMLILLFVNMLLCSIFTIVFDVFFGLIPGINSWGYFADWWDTSVNYNLGQSPLLLIFSIQQQRVSGNKNVLFCCFEMPFWGYLIILYVMCQLMIYPPWYGVEYNLAGLIVGYMIPKRFLMPQQQIVNIDVQQNDTYAYAQTQQTNNQQYQQQQEEKQKQEKQKQEQNSWKGKGHTL